MHIYANDNSSEKRLQQFCEATDNRYSNDILQESLDHTEYPSIVTEQSADGVPHVVNGLPGPTVSRSPKEETS